METDLLRTFVLVSEELNFTRAAERLHLSQPSLSRRIRDLEQILGGRLFDRGPRKVEITPFGAQQLPRAIAVLAQVDEFVDRARNGGPTRRLDLGIAANAIDQLAIDALRPMRAADPDLQLTIRRVELGEQASSLRSGTIDALIGRLPFEDPSMDDLSSVDVWSDPVMLVVPTHHPLAEAASIDVARLETITLLSTAWLPTTWQQANAAFAAASSRSTTGFASETFKDLITAVSVEGIPAVAPQSFASAYSNNLTVAVPIDGVEPMRIVLATVATRVDDPLVQSLFDSVRIETAADYPELREIQTVEHSSV
jgi:DNA-binding transcriptional LysR family regulator